MDHDGLTHHTDRGWFQASTRCVAVFRAPTVEAIIQSPPTTPKALEQVLRGATSTNERRSAEVQP